MTHSNTKTIYQMYFIIFVLSTKYWGLRSHWKWRCYDIHYKYWLLKHFWV